MSIRLNKVQAKGVAHFLSKRKEDDVTLSSNDSDGLNVGKSSGGKRYVKIHFAESTVTINKDGSWVDILNPVTIPASEIGSGTFQEKP